MFTISDTHKTSFRDFAFLIEKRLLELQVTLSLQRLAMRFEHIHYVNRLTMEEEAKTQEQLNKIYNLLQKFCVDYNIPKDYADLKKELRIKAGFLLEDIGRSASRCLNGHMMSDEYLKNDYELKITELIEAANYLVKQLK